MVVVPTGKILPSGTPLRAILTRRRCRLLSPFRVVFQLRPRRKSSRRARIYRHVCRSVENRRDRVVNSDRDCAAALVNGAALPSPESRTVNWKLSGPL